MTYVKGPKTITLNRTSIMKSQTMRRRATLKVFFTYESGMKVLILVNKCYFSTTHVLHLLTLSVIPK